MSKLEAEAIQEEAVSMNIECQIKRVDDVYIVELNKKRWLSYWYAIMSLWELEYKQEGTKI